jgi:hypothetical protein
MSSHLFYLKCFYCDEIFNHFFQKKYHLSYHHKVNKLLLNKDIQDIQDIQDIKINRVEQLEEKIVELEKRISYLENLEKSN